MKANKQIKIIAQLLEVKTQIINKPEVKNRHDCGNRPWRRRKLNLLGVYHMKRIDEMTVEELRDELRRTEQCLHSVFEEAKWNADPSLSAAFYEFQNEADRIRNRLWEMEVNV